MPFCPKINQVDTYEALRFIRRLLSANFALIDTCISLLIILKSVGQQDSAYA